MGLTASAALPLAVAAGLGALVTLGMAATAAMAEPMGETVATVGMVAMAESEFLAAGVTQTA